MVISEQFRFPYSKGLMARSLIRSGLPSEDAYRLASRIQEILIEQGAKELSRRSLKTIATQLLEEQFGLEAARKYESWKIAKGTIHVGDESQGEPFSRGILAQSLLAAGLTPEIAHSVTEKMTADLEDWEVRKLRVMYDLLQQKFAPGTPLAQQLMATAPGQLVEGNNWGDRFWGVCDGDGLNILGRMLMNIRDKLILGG